LLFNSQLDFIVFIQKVSSIHHPKISIQK